MSKCIIAPVFSNPLACPLFSGSPGSFLFSFASKSLRALIYPPSCGASGSRLLTFTKSPPPQFWNYPTTLTRDMQLDPFGPVQVQTEKEPEPDLKFGSARFRFRFMKK